MLPRLIATDLDGTLLRRDLSVGPRTRAAVAAVGERSVFVFATGRPARWLDPVVAATGHRGLAVAANGALVLDLERGGVVYDHLLDPGVAGDAVATLQEAIPGLGFGVERLRDGFHHDPAYRPTFAVDPGTRVAPIGDLLEGPLIKLLVRHEEMGGDDLLAAVRRVCGDLVEATRSSHDALVEVMVAGSSKAAALAWVAGHYGIDPSDTAAFGDMPNDLAMLEWAGYAVAVDNAHPDVKAVADEVTASNDDEGVALVLERWLAAPA